jgi:hypothetical protein
MVVLLNDETHTFEQVVRQVVKSVGCDRKQAAAMATRVDHVKRALLFVSPNLAAAI